MGRASVAPDDSIFALTCLNFSEVALVLGNAIFQQHCKSHHQRPCENDFATAPHISRLSWKCHAGITNPDANSANAKPDELRHKFT